MSDTKDADGTVRVSDIKDSPDEELMETINLMANCFRKRCDPGGESVPAHSAVIGQIRAGGNGFLVIVMRSGEVDEGAYAKALDEAKLLAIMQGAEGAKH